MHFIKYLMLLPAFVLTVAAGTTSRDENKLDYNSRLNIEQHGGCQDAQPFDATININVLPQRIKFKKDIEHVNFAALSQREINKWVKENNLYAYWIPEGHLKGGHLIVSGLGFKVDAERYTSPIDKAGELVCGYFSKVDITMFYGSNIMTSSKITNDPCEYEVYIDHMEQHTKQDDDIFAAFLKTLREEEIFNIIEYSEGDRYVLNDRWKLKSLTRYQTERISKALGAYVQSIANEMEYQGTRLDLSDDYIQMNEKLKACKEKS